MERRGGRAVDVAIRRPTLMMMTSLFFCKTLVNVQSHGCECGKCVTRICICIGRRYISLRTLHGTNRTHLASPLHFRCSAPAWTRTRLAWWVGRAR